MKKYLIIIMLAILAVGCNKKQEQEQLTIVKVPKEIIQQEEMVNLLTEVLLIECRGVVETQNSRDQSLIIDSLYANLFGEYNISSQQFDQSLQWYSEHLDMYQQMYSEVTNNLYGIKDHLISERDSSYYSGQDFQDVMPQEEHNMPSFMH